MSTLTEQERIALEDIFLSISVNQPSAFRWKTLRCSGSSFLKLGEKIKTISKQTQTLIYSRKTLKTYASAKVFLRQNKQKLSKNIGIRRYGRD